MSMDSSKKLNWDSTRLTALGGIFTASEIEQQPALWLKVAELLASQNEKLAAFLDPLLSRRELRIILTGAGSSAFIGKCLSPVMQKKLKRRIEAIPTTDLVSGPQCFFQADVPTLLVSFARSGSSPESLAAVDLANQLCPDIYHLVITCNEQGMLYRRSASRNAMVILLPDETHDRGFAMTSSYTSMLLSAALAFGVIDPAPMKMSALHDAGRDILRRALPLLADLVAGNFERVVYLGSNELLGLAEESALKLLELTDGRVVATFNSPLGFRHGPKTIVNPETLIILFLSNDPYTRQYDLDLLKELEGDGKAARIIAIGAKNDLTESADYFVVPQLKNASDLELAVTLVVFAQIFSFYQSLALGITPDTPSVSGTVNRVVQGVNIYPLVNGA